MTKFLFIRHGESVANKEEYFAGHTDAPLSELGVKQAKATAKYIAESYKVDKIYASPLQRAYNTGAELADILGICETPHWGLAEISAGKWEGMHFSDIEKTYAEDFGVWLCDIGNSRPTEGESVKELFLRVTETIDKLAFENRGKTVAIATHATPIRAVVCKGSGFDHRAMKDIKWVSNASVTELFVENGVWTLGKTDIKEHLASVGISFLGTV